MNRLFFNREAKDPPTHTNPLHRPARQMRRETENMIREMAYVLQLTLRIKGQILEEEEETVGV